MAGRSSERDLDACLAPFLSAMGRKTRRTWAPLYLRGLLGPGDRKSLQPMAARLGLSGHDCVSACNFGSDALLLIIKA